jgi:14-3-3 protein epsilon
MRKIYELTPDLTKEELNLLQVAYKNVVGQRRISWKAITAYEIKEKAKVN